MRTWGSGLEKVLRIGRGPVEIWTREFHVARTELSGWRTLIIKPKEKPQSAKTEVASAKSGPSTQPKPKNTPITISKPSISFDFPSVIKQLPADIRQLEVINFPLINPWRMDTIADRMSDTEVSFQDQRGAILKKAQLKSSQFPSVTKVLQVSMSDQAKLNLEKWKANMIAELGEVGFVEYQRNLFARGSALHRSIAKKLQDQKLTPQDITKLIEGLWSSLEHVFPHIDRVRLVEKHLYHPFLMYKGVADCVALYDGELFLIDWKTSSRAKPSLFNLYDEPIQAVAYLGALNYDPQFSYQVDKMALVIAYEDGQPATVHRMTPLHCRDYWKQWLARLKVYHDVNVNQVAS